MATYLKRTSKLFDVSLSQASTEMNLRDVICPVCRGILIEPVTLPCTHNLCLRCLKGTFEHNSLSCPLCRVRVGSWLRSATKSETLINSELWDLIRSRFPKEIEGKHNDHDTEVATDAVYPPKIISAAGEIRREYEMQLQIAEEEMRIQRKAEIMANEALIRKLQEEEHKELAQYAQDQLLAKTLAKKQLLTKDRNGSFYNSYMNIKMPSSEVEISPLDGRPSLEQKASISHVKNERANISNIDATCDFGKSSQRPENVVLDLKFATNRKGFCQAPNASHNVVTLKHQSVMLIPKASYNYSEPSCSNSKIYGTRSEEELRVPSDVLSSSKGLGIEFCIATIKNDDERIGSAESAGSHDSINQEIHHFKPIKATARTPLRYSRDGRQIDPKLIRVVPIFERVSRGSPKPPSPSKRIIGCTWSAFKGKIQQTQRPASLAQSIPTSKPTKRETVRKIDLAQDISFDNNKHYAKGINRILNGTKLSKKLILDNETENTADQTWQLHINNGSAEANTKYKNPNERRDLCADENSSPILIQASTLSNDENGATIENIAERIKRRKVAQPQKINSIVKKNQSPRTRGKTQPPNKQETNLPLKSKRKPISKSKRLKVQFKNETEIIQSPHDEDDEMETVKITRKSSRSKSKDSIAGPSERMEEEKSEDFDAVAIEEQEKMERLLRQEKEDYELAQRLQAQFNEPENISCRTRGSKRACDSGGIERGLNKIRISGKIFVNDVNTASTSNQAMKSRRRQKQDKT